MIDLQDFENKFCLSKNLEKHNSGISRLSFGVLEIDELLQGGLPVNKITEITGSETSGKTSLAFKIISNAHTPYCPVLNFK